jgi:hypothetical protein
MIADQKDFITPHITDAHTLDYPCFHTGFVCEYELPRWDPIHIGRFAIDISPTRHVVMLWIAALLCIVTTLLALRAHNRRTRDGKAPSGFGNGLEALVLYLRNEVVLPNVGAHGNGYVPYLLTLFFFILFANLLGLVPYGSTATGNISVTATLAIITFIVVEVAGMKAQWKVHQAVCAGDPFVRQHDCRPRRPAGAHQPHFHLWKLAAGAGARSHGARHFGSRIVRRISAGVHLHASVQRIHRTDSRGCALTRSVLDFARVSGRAGRRSPLGREPR